MTEQKQEDWFRGLWFQELRHTIRFTLIGMAIAYLFAEGSVAVIMAVLQRWLYHHD